MLLSESVESTRNRRNYCIKGEKLEKNTSMVVRDISGDKLFIVEKPAAFRHLVEEPVDGFVPPCFLTSSIRRAQVLLISMPGQNKNPSTYYEYQNNERCRHI